MRSLAVIGTLAVALAGCSVSTNRAADASAPPYESVDQVMVTGTSVSTSEIDLEVTPGPPYLVQRQPTQSTYFPVTLGTIPSGSTTFRDTGQDHTPAQTSSTGGLNTDWTYSYIVTVLEADGVTPDPRFQPLTISVSTYAAPGKLPVNNPSDSASASAT